MNFLRSHFFFSDIMQVLLENNFRKYILTINFIVKFCRIKLLWFWYQTLKFIFTKIIVLNIFIGMICVLKIQSFHKNNLGSMEVKKCSLFYFSLLSWVSLLVVLNFIHYNIFWYELVFFYTRFENKGVRNSKIINEAYLWETV